MSPRSTEGITGSSVVRFFAQAAMVVGALLVVTVLLAAMPGHNAPTEETYNPQSVSAPNPAPRAMPAMDHGRMTMDSDESVSEKGAVTDMSQMRGGPHMHLTAMRPENPEDRQRASEIVRQLRTGIEKYKDYHVALDAGYRIFLPNLPQPEYHFTNYAKGFMATLRFDPSEPTSLLYRKTADGYELVGAMYTMPKRSSEKELNERVPLSVAMWHLHTNLCMPPRDQRQGADWTKFGLQGSLATEEACDAAGGKFYPSIFGWMVHVYPYEDSLDKIFAMHHHD